MNEIDARDRAILRILQDHAGIAFRLFAAGDTA